MAVDEFELIDKYFSNIGTSTDKANSTDSNKVPVIDLAVGDDCALLTIPANQQLALSIDTLVADVHFPTQGDAYCVAQKALRCNLSDLAAMGAEPLAFTLALTLPSADELWLAAFSRGLHDCANEFKLPLIGGDTTHGPVTTITIQIMGTVPTGIASLRSGANVGDAIFVSGTLGDARAALDFLAVPAAQLNADQKIFLSRYYTPMPRIALGIALRNIAHAAIDISDGLAADLGHILERSAVGATIDLDKLPLSAALQKHPNAIEFALHGGDDYELCFTVPPQHKNQIEAIARALSISLTEIGTIVAGDQLIARNKDGAEQSLQQRGYKHFTNTVPLGT